MRTTLDLDPELLEQARRVTGASTKTAVVEMGLRALVKEAAMKRLIALRGAIPAARAPRRRLLALARTR